MMIATMLVFGLAAAVIVAQEGPGRPRRARPLCRRW
jgi:hypothetical protein